jgi:hypothetical protein
VTRGLGPVIGLGVVIEEMGEGLERDATVLQPDEDLTCRKFAGPQPNGVIVNTTASMIIRVTIVTTTATAIRWVRVPGIFGKPERGSMLRNRSGGLNGYEEASSWAKSAWLAGSKRLSSTAVRAAASASSRRPSWMSTRARLR